MALNHATSPVGDFSVFKRIKKFYAELRRKFVTKSTSGGCGQFETSPEGIEPQLLKLFCERRQTDRLKTNYSIDTANLQMHFLNNYSFFLAESHVSVPFSWQFFGRIESTLLSIIVE